MNDRFVVKTTVSKADTYALAKQQIRKNRVFMWLCTLVLIVGTVLVWIRDDENKIFFAVMTVLLTLMSIFMDKMIGWMMYRNVNKTAGETTYTFTDADVFMRCEVREGGIPYDAFTELVETDERFFLYIQKRAAFIMPKKDFIEGDAAEFAKFVSKKTAKEFRRVRG